MLLVLGSGTTAVMAKKLQRNFIGFEQDQDYIKLAKKRLKNTQSLSDDIVTMAKSRKDLPKIPFGELVEQGIIPPGAVLTDKKERYKATVRIDGTLKTKNLSGSIHQLGAQVQGLPSCNGWDFWHIKNKTKSTLLDEVICRTVTSVVRPTDVRRTIGHGRIYNTDGRTKGGRVLRPRRALTAASRYHPQFAFEAASCR